MRSTTRCSRRQHEHAGPLPRAHPGARSAKGNLVSTQGRSQALDVLACPLQGLQLIEASAGTGKTWNICGLVLRLLLEQGLEVQRILVVTFTNVATAELRERVRQRIIETLAHVKEAAPADVLITALVAKLRATASAGDETMQRRLEMALACFDEAAIFTIHGFCQRALSDQPFSAQMPLAMELLHDDSALLLEAASDFWRRHVAGDELDPALAAELARNNDSPQKLARLLKRHLAKPVALSLWPQGLDDVVAPDWAPLQQAQRAAAALWHAQRQAIVELVNQALNKDLKANIYKPETLALAQTEWDDLLRCEDAVAALAQKANKLDLLGKHRLVKDTKKGMTPPSHPFFDAAQTLLDLRADAARQLSLLRLRLLRDMLAEAAAQVRLGKRQRRVLGYDDLLFNLHERLHGAQGAALANSLRARFPAALIDEFQDTDPLQFGIFKAIYADSAAPLFLVGDPKQAIYSFRNADLHTYLQAGEQASARHTLAHNQRSVAPLLSALNALFSRNPRAFMLEGLAYQSVAAGTKPRKPLQDASAARAALQLWALPGTLGHEGHLLPKAAAKALAAGSVATEITHMLSAADQGLITLDGQPLRAGDIAVLVRTHAEARLMRGALAERAVGCVELSQASVFDSPDAQDLDAVLAAVLEPAREGLLKLALATETQGLDAAAIAALAQDESGWLEIAERFVRYRDTWAQRGVGIMLRQWLSAENVAARMLARGDGERRLTNLLHLFECLHQASATLAGPEALLRWFQAQRREQSSDDAVQLRLESDQNLVQIVTIHKSKGLEYPIVFCPFLWNGTLGGAPSSQEGSEYHDDQGRAVIDYRAGLDPDHDPKIVKQRIQLEASAEWLRLAYVALTRAVHRCVLVAGGYTTRGKAASTKESEKALLNWLVAGATQSPDEWLKDGQPLPAIAQAWSALAADAVPAAQLGDLPAALAQPLQPRRAAPENIAALAPPTQMPEAWWIASYSGMMHGATHERAAADHDLRVEASPKAAGIGPLRANQVDDDDILGFPRGPAAGDCLHQVFETIDFTAPEGWPQAIADALLTLPPQAAQQAGSQRHGAMLQRMLREVLDTEIPLGTARPLRLATLPLQRRLTELEFYLPASHLDAAALNALLARHGLSAPRLSFRTLSGFLKGFIDLVFEHEGRYFVLDWKSNHLGERVDDYGSAAMEAAMVEHGYHLQALFYSVALDRYLGQRLPDYDAARHLGGVAYLFIRGLRPHARLPGESPTGLHFQPPALAAVRDMAAWLGSTGAPA